MKCEDAQVLLDQYIDGELHGSLAAEVGLHVKQCPRCTAEMEALAKAGAVLRDALGEEPARDLFPEVLAQCRRDRGLSRSSRTFWGLPFRLAAVGAVALCVAAVALLMNPPQKPALSPGLERRKQSASEHRRPHTPDSLPLSSPAYEVPPAPRPGEQGLVATAPARRTAKVAAASKRRIASVELRRRRRPVPEAPRVRRRAEAPVLIVLAEPAQPSMSLSAVSADDLAPASFKVEFTSEQPDPQSLRSLSVVKRMGPDGAVESLDISFTLPDMTASRSEEREDSDEEHRRSHRGGFGRVVLVSGP